MYSTVFREQRGLINYEDIIDILAEVSNVQKYLENEALKILLFGNPDLTVGQCRQLVFKYGETLNQKDLQGRKLFVRMVMLLDSRDVIKKKKKIREFLF